MAARAGTSEVMFGEVGGTASASSMAAVAYDEITWRNLKKAFIYIHKHTHTLNWTRLSL